MYVKSLLKRETFNCARVTTKAAVGLLLFCSVIAESSSAQTTYKVIGWNNLGMHCMDSDYSVFSILPPYNTVNAHIVRGTSGTAHLIQTDIGYSVTYQGIADGSGSINTTSRDKSNFWTYCPLLLGVVLAEDAGVPLPGYGQYFMPGTNNTPQPMTYQSSPDWFEANGIPITPYDNDLQKNAYPLMRLTAKSGSTAIAQTDVVLPVSDEMDCRICHASGSSPAARPPEGWVWIAKPEQDYRLNILRMHDAVRFQEMPTDYRTSLAAAGYTTNGLFSSVIENGKPVFCAHCHNSEALPDSGIEGIPPLTQAVHGLHAGVIDPLNGLTLNAVNNRSSCYRCHPGSETRCLRGAMGSAVTSSGDVAMQCQSCHGSMSTVASPNRIGWLNEPNCQACHTGDAVSNNGQIRYTSVFVSNDVMRVAVNNRFATNPDTPAENLSLYRFSRGHGGLHCSACHGSTHAIYPSIHTNDNITAIQFQGHEGTFSECAQCHAGSPNTLSNGPHGMHPVGQPWLEGHKNPGKNEANCITCHGTDERGTVLSRSQRTWSFTIYDGNVTRTFWRGYQIGCYTCHQGSNNNDRNPKPLPAVQNVSTSTAINTPVTFTLPGTDNNSLTWRIVKQPNHGRIGINGSTATYYPDNAFEGTDNFTFAASDNQSESNLGYGTVTVTGGSCAYTLVPSSRTHSELSQAGTLTVATGTTCEWNAASETRWLSIISPAGRTTGPGNVTYAVARNTDASPRTGRLRIAGKIFTVNQAGAPPDNNGDGLPDSWQEMYFTNASDPDAAPGADPDLDGVINSDEYKSGTEPDNGGSALTITSFVLSQSEELFNLAFPSVSTLLYQVQKTADLTSPDWHGYTNAVTGTGTTLPQIGPLIPGEDRMFYRVLLVE